MDIEYLRDEVKDFTTSAVPIGVDKETLSIKTYDFASQFVNLVTGASMDEYEPFVEGLVDVFAQVKDCEFMVIDPTASLQNDLNKPYRYIAEQTELKQSLSNYLTHWFTEIIQQRMPLQQALSHQYFLSSFALFIHTMSFNPTYLQMEKISSKSSWIKERA